jgi:hypothetical protein
VSEGDFGERGSQTIANWWTDRRIYIFNIVEDYNETVTINQMEK